MAKSLSWSYTRSRAYNACPRSLYFALHSDPAPDNEGAPNAVSAFAMPGIAVHEAIAKHIGSWSDGSKLHLGEAVQIAESSIERRWQNQQNQIIEAANGKKLTQDDLRRMLGIARASLRTFYRSVWPRFHGHEYISHESLSSFDLGHARVWVRLDLCTRDPDGCLVITDWKTTRSTVPESDALQLDAYALWAIHEAREEPERIVVQLANVRTGSFIQRAPGHSELEAARERIAREVEAWTSGSNPSSFPPDPEPQKCLACPYLNQCQDGMEMVQSSDT